MSNFISNIFNTLASIPQAAGKFLYDAGIPDPMATAYGEKLTNQSKAQLLQLQAQKEAEEYKKLKLQNDLDSVSIQILKHSGDEIAMGRR